MSKELYLCDAHELAQKLRDGEVTAEALVQMFLDRIETLDTKIHAYLYVDAQGASFRWGAYRHQRQYGDPRQAHYLRLEDFGRLAAAL